MFGTVRSKKGTSSMTPTGQQHCLSLGYVLWLFLGPPTAANTGL